MNLFQAINNALDIEMASNPKYVIYLVDHYYSEKTWNSEESLDALKDSTKSMAPTVFSIHLYVNK